MLIEGCGVGGQFGETFAMLEDVRDRESLASCRENPGSWQSLRRLSSQIVVIPSHLWDWVYSFASPQEKEPFYGATGTSC